ncbi:MAG TPA: hypothetical protein VNN08_04400 [Thermoanaerobaculia bacterium]|nr:hypothetical protein [Thermoanaerobaculia bacterium]
MKTFLSSFPVILSCHPYPVILEQQPRFNLVMLAPIKFRGGSLRGCEKTAPAWQFVILSLPQPLSERRAAEDGEGSPVAAPGAGAKLWFSTVQGMD